MSLVSNTWTSPTVRAERWLILDGKGLPAVFFVVDQRVRVQFGNEVPLEIRLSGWVGEVAFLIFLR